MPGDALSYKCLFQGKHKVNTLVSKYSKLLAKVIDLENYLLFLFFGIKT